VVTNLATAGKGILSFTTNGSATPSRTCGYGDKQRKPGLQQPHRCAQLGASLRSESLQCYRAQNYRVLAASRSCFCPWLGRQTSDFNLGLLRRIAVTGFVSGQSKLTYPMS